MEKVCVALVGVSLSAIAACSGGNANTGGSASPGSEGVMLS